MRILIADDNLDLAESLALVLQARGANVIVVGDGESAVWESQHKDFDAALLDLMLPNMSGGEVLRRFDADGRIPLLLAMTGFDGGRIEDLVGVPGVPVLRKPFDISDLLEALGLGETATAIVMPPRCRIAVLLDEGGKLPSKPADCIVDRFEEIDTLQEAVAEYPYDAIALLHEDEKNLELREVLKLLDRDVAVLFGLSPTLLAGAVERTRERREARGELGMLEEAFERCPAPMLIAGGEPVRVLRWNGELGQQLGYAEDDLEGAPLELLDGDPDGTSLVGLASEIHAGRTEATRRVAVRLRGGTVRLYDVRAVPVDALDHGLCLSFDAVDQRARHAAALRDLGATAAGVAHEMRNTLAGVGNSLAVLKGRLDQETVEHEVVVRVLGRVARAGEVLADLLDYARPTTPRLKAVPARMVLNAAADQIREQAPEGVEVVTDVEDATLRILVDPVGVQGALVNLGMNAVQALESGGRVAITCRLHGDWVELCVRDSGPGIPESNRDKIFQPFFTTRSRGSGLGLANVRKLVEAHGGRVELLDRGPGAHFLVRLPPRPELPAEEP
jgi:signal transduction histidine kinase/ActR/RegA family two-component response regulator